MYRQQRKSQRLHLQERHSQNTVEIQAVRRIHQTTRRKLNQQRHARNQRHHNSQQLYRLQQATNHTARPIRFPQATIQPQQRTQQVPQAKLHRRNQTTHHRRPQLSHTPQLSLTSRHNAYHQAHHKPHTQQIPTTRSILRILRPSQIRPNTILRLWTKPTRLQQKRTR